MIQYFGYLLLFVTLIQRVDQLPFVTADPVPITPVILNIYPHDTNAFTQGLVFHNNTLYESTGLYGSSSLRRVNVTSGEVQQRLLLSSSYFAEGLTVFSEKLIQLTWTSRIAFLWDFSFSPVGNFSYPTDGWGLTHNNTHLILSDGSSTLYYLDPTTYQIVLRISVYYMSGSSKILISNLNELEYVNGYIWANVWYSTRVAIIEPDTGIVVAWVVLDELQREGGGGGERVANGIAYNSITDKLYLTGKLWSKLFEIEVITPPSEGKEITVN